MTFHSGAKTRTIESMKNLLAVAGLLFIASLVLFASDAAVASKSKLPPETIESINRAKQIATACLLYEMDHKDQFPRALADLLPDYLPNDEIFRCPLSPKEAVGYDYFQISPKDAAKTTWLRSKSKTADGKYVIVCRDGSYYLESTK